MKSLFFLVGLFSLYCSDATAQEIMDSSIEVKLRIIQLIDDNGAGNLALSLSVINHSNKDIYLAGLGNVGYFFGIHLAQKQSGEYKEIDLLGQPTGHDVGFRYSDNKISSHYLHDSPTLKEGIFEDSLFDLFCSREGLSKRIWQRNRPLFLKAGQELADFRVYNIANILKQPGDYKIFFKADPPDPRYSPPAILGFKVYASSLITSNVLYYSAVSDRSLSNHN